MTDRVSHETASDLAATFYQHLAQHGEPDTALGAGPGQCGGSLASDGAGDLQPVGGLVYRTEATRNRQAPDISCNGRAGAEHFTGREEELEWLLETLQTGRAVTIWASGGMGKTALSAEAIWRLAPDDEPPELFPDGLIFYSFYGRRETASALEHIVKSFDEEAQDVSEDAAPAGPGRQTALVGPGRRRRGTKPERRPAS